MIEFENVSASYDGELPILRDVSFRIPDGDFVAFVGTNGAGKSTTMRLVNGLLKPSSGQVLIDGVPTVQLRTSQFETWSHQMRLASATNVTGELYQAACSLLAQTWDFKTPLRQLGVQVTQLSDGTLRQYSLFDAADYARQEKLDTAVDALREKFGEGALFRAALLHSDERMAGGLHKKRRTGITKPVEVEAARIRKKYGGPDEKD